MNEWDTFNPDVDLTRQQITELYQMLPKIWPGENFGWNSDMLRPKRRFSAVAVMAAENLPVGCRRVVGVSELG